MNWLDPQGAWVLDGPTDDEGYKLLGPEGSAASEDDPKERQWIATFYDGNREGPGPFAMLALDLMKRELGNYLVPGLRVGEIIFCYCCACGHGRLIWEGQCDCKCGCRSERYVKLGTRQAEIWRAHEFQGKHCR